MGWAARMVSLLLGGVFMALAAGCAQTGRLQTEAPGAVARAEQSLPDTIRRGTSSSFFVLGDTQGSWRVEHRFYRRAAWATWKQALVPFYQLYWIGNGVVGGINYLRHRPDLGAEPRAAVRTALRQAWQASRAAPPDRVPRFVLHLGDMVEDGRYPAHWSRFVDEYAAGEQALPRTMPFLPTIGNHEMANDTVYGKPNYDALFDRGRFYVIDLPHAAVIVLDSNRLVDMGQYLDDDRQEAIYRQWFVGEDEPAWLERVLQARADRPFKIVAMHHPLLTLAMHDTDWYSAANGRSLAAKRRALLDVLKAHGVQLVLSGHEHLYARNQLRYRKEEREWLLHQIISSGGGAVVRPETPPAVRQQRLARYHAQGIAMEPVMQRSVYHYSRVTAGPDSLRLTTWAVDPDAPRAPTVLDRIVIGPEGHCLSAPRPAAAGGNE